MSNAILMRGVGFAYGERSILNSVDLEIESSRLTVILGRNGSGKSTLLRLMAGFLEPSEGVVEVMGHDLHRLSLSERASLVSFLPQKHRAVFPFSVEDVVLTGRARYITMGPGRKDRDAASAAIEQVGISDMRNRPYTELSGGEQQLVLIARVLAQDPKVILLDEPTAHLDLTNAAAVLGLIRSLVKRGTTAVAVLHDPNLASLYGDAHLFLAHGGLLIPPNNTTPWDAAFLRSVYECPLSVVPYNGKALVVPEAK